MKAPKVQPPRIPSERPGPKGGKRDQNRQHKAQVLADAALDLFLAKGIDRVTVAELAKAAGMAKGSFYRYAEDIADVVARLLEPLSSGVDQAVEAARSELEGAAGPNAVADIYQRLAAKLLGVVFAMPGVVRLYLQESRGPAVGARAPIVELRERIHAHAIELTRFAQEHGLLRPVRVDISALTVVGAVELHLYRMLTGQAVGDPAEGARELVSLILDGVGRP
ncbi:MAG: TetR/AcrR family transcriptional regulator [Deltaproteobacteria bacterium]|nr:TetR/AcrR family transcriptional regulator [Deltaproteobacteria bacterium]